MNIERPICTHGRATIHRKNNVTEKNPYKFMIAMGHNNDFMPTRTFVSKGYESTHIAVRDFVESETGKPMPWRYVFFVYKDAEGLIADEWDVTKDREWCLELIEKLRVKKSLEKIISDPVQGSINFTE